jgi:hypothetical protein
MVDVTARLAPDRALPRVELNAIAGHAGAWLVAHLLTGAEVETNLPGPGGRPGGYPVRLRGRIIELNLPAGVSEDDAVAWNTAAGRRDGIDVSGGRVTYPAPAREALSGHLPDLAAGWAVTDLPAVYERFAALRHDLRAAAPASAG